MALPRAASPSGHLKFVAGLPLFLSLPGLALRPCRGAAGRGDIDHQSDEDLIWIREPFLNGPGMPGVRVVHGHTPTPRAGGDAGADRYRHKVLS